MDDWAEYSTKSAEDAVMNNYGNRNESPKLTH